MKAAEIRLLLEARAKIERETTADMAALQELAKKYHLRVISEADWAEFRKLRSSPQPEAQPAPPAPLEVPAPPAENIKLPWNGVETIAQLADIYRTDERSPYRALRFGTRNNADNFIDRIVSDFGEKRLADLNADSIWKMYESWADGGKLATGHAFVTKLRGLLSFGTVTLDDAGCQRLSIIMNRMRFPTPPAREERLTKEHATAIRAEAHAKGKPSIALAQAIQFEFGLGQKDAIGEYVPATEPGTSDIIVNGMKWLHGIRWENVDDALVLRHETSFGGKLLELDLKRAPMVMEELQKQFKGIVPKSGPIIISEWSGKPWSGNEFRRWWRKLADGAGVPKAIKNMDSGRAADREQFAVKGAPFEGLDLDGDTEVSLH
ncbi:hypothetical protein [Bradyrhizobium sp. 62]|uniref:hypothetical protein n=1 Tax=Bradyrhizobium sp. 62 TaxID=1043588 RepID=UPI001FF82736|nr:hypothetical protein [Bradyrhizobium sp. 62]MCK1362941.1 hypothetical protein [Bradyrhizobium sp. 62]